MKKTKVLLLVLGLLTVCVVFPGCVNKDVPRDNGAESGIGAVSDEQETKTETEFVKETEAVNETSTPETKAEETKTPDIQKLPLGERVTSLDDIDKLDAPSLDIAVAKAFLGKDLKKLDELCGRNNAAYQQLSTVEISSFEVWCEDNAGSVDNDLFMDITVSAVGDKNVTPLREGKYSLALTGRVTGICIEIKDENKETAVPKTETEKFMSAWLSHIGYKFGMEYNTGLTQYYIEFVHSYYKAVHGEGGTKETYERYYQELFEADCSNVIEGYLTFENGGKAEIRYGHGGSGFYYDFVESGDDYVVVQLYADGGQLVYGPKIKYTFTRAGDILIPDTHTFLYGEDILPLGYTL